MDKLLDLRAQLNGVNVSDDMIARGVRLTQDGIDKLCRRYGVNDDGLTEMLSELAEKMRDELRSQNHNVININEFAEQAVDGRYTYEADFMGNLTLRDTKTGNTQYIQGDDAFKLIHEIELAFPNYQAILAPYFESVLREFTEKDVQGDMGTSGGTYNFPYKGDFACARFYLANNKPVVEVISLVDRSGDEIPMDDATKADATRVAWEWVDKV